MGRTKQFDEEQALAAAMHLFWEKGYGAASLQDLEEVTGLKRTSIYNTFGNKRRLFQQTLRLYRDQVQAGLDAIMAEAPTCRQAMAAWFQAVIAMHFDKETPGGCLMMLSVLESSQHDEETKELAASLFHYEQQAVQARLQQGVDQGELAADFDSRAVAGALAATSSGLMVLAMANYRRAELEAIVTAALRLVG